MKIKKVALVCLAVIAAGIFVSCATTTKRGFSQFDGKVWKLSTVENFMESETFNRKTMDEKTFEDAFTIQFDNNNVFGKGWPNRFRGSYTLGANNSITFSPMAATLMMAFAEPKGLTEHEFFNLLNSATTWELRDDSLLIYTKDGSMMKFTK